MIYGRNAPLGVFTASRDISREVPLGAIAITPVIRSLPEAIVKVFEKIYFFAKI
jgi:hypothetical protein